MSETSLTFIGSDLRGDVLVPSLPDWRLAVTRRGTVLLATGTGNLSAKEARTLARALYRAARIAEAGKTQDGGTGLPGETMGGD